jgi:hypothetical protein
MNKEQLFEDLSNLLGIILMIGVMLYILTFAGLVFAVSSYGRYTETNEITYLVIAILIPVVDFILLCRWIYNRYFN